MPGKNFLHADLVFISNTLFPLCPHHSQYGRVEMPVWVPLGTLAAAFSGISIIAAL